MPMIQAVIFDCFGVLTTEGWLPFKRRYFGASGRRFDEATELRRQADAGLLSYQDFVNQIAVMAGTDTAEVNESLRTNSTNEELLNYIQRELKPHYKIGFLSNSGSDVLTRLFTPQQAGLFDEVSISYQTGVTKPDTAAYHQLAQRLGVQPDQCIFIDDQERHCSGARQAGMQAIAYQDFEQMKTELKQLLTDSKK